MTQAIEEIVEIKQDLRGDVLSYLDELDDAGSYQMLREFTDKLNTIEIKSITGKLSDREVSQLSDYLKMAEGNAEAGEMGRRVRKIRYTFTRPEGLKENLEVWTFTADGKETRIDHEYNPAPVAPAWGQALEPSER